jgi:hypothetical protein
MPANEFFPPSERLFKLNQIYMEQTINEMNIFQLILKYLNEDCDLCSPSSSFSSNYNMLVYLFVDSINNCLFFLLVEILLVYHIFILMVVVHLEVEVIIE